MCVTIPSFTLVDSEIQSSEENSLKIEWVDGFEIKTAAENSEIIISANREGNLSLEKQLTALVQEQPGSHIHYDEYNSLEEGSTEMIIEKHGKPSSENNNI